MRHATLALVSLSIALTAGCASPSQPGGSPQAPPTHLDHPEGHVDGVDHAGASVHVVPPYEPAVPESPDGAPTGTPAAPVAHPGAGHGMDHGAAPTQTGAGAQTPITSRTEPFSFRSEVVPILQKHCASCHTAGAPGAQALTMFDAEGAPQYEAIKDQFGRMLLEIQSGRMPKGAPNSLSQAEFDTLDQWGAAEMPNN